MKTQKIIKVLSKKDYGELEKIKKDQHRAIIMLLTNTGLRVSELTSLNIKDVFYNDMTQKDVISVVGKGTKLRTIPLTRQAKESIFQLMQDSKSRMRNLFDLDSPLVVSQKRTRMTRIQIFRIMDKYNKELNLSIDISPHTFRHCFATSLIRKGASIKDVQTLLGHSDIITTMRTYSHSTSESLREAVNLLEG